MLVTLKITSKNKHSYKRFIKFLLNEIQNLNKFPTYITKLNRHKTKKTIFTVLKSPHVNKTAQEQFEIRNYNSSIKIYSYSNVFLVFLLKQLIKGLCKDINVKIKICSNNKKFLNILRNNIDFDFNFLGQNSAKNLKGYIKSLDQYGEISFLNK